MKASEENYNNVRNWLYIAALCYCLGGVYLLLRASFFCIFIGLDLHELMAVHIMGISTVVLGIGHLFASIQPLRYWQTSLISLLFNIVFSLYFFTLYYYGYVGVFVWWPIAFWVFFGFLFFKIIQKVYLQQFEQDAKLISIFSQDQHLTLSTFETNHDETLAELCENSPIMLVFLRHFGCLFCMETLQDLQQKRKLIESYGVRIVLVHMASSEVTLDILKKYNLEDLDCVSDEESILYKKFSLKRATLEQLFGLNVLISSARIYLQGKRPSMEFLGDRFQMPGVFLIYRNQIIKKYMYHHIAERPDFVQIAKAAICQ